MKNRFFWVQMLLLGVVIVTGGLLLAGAVAPPASGTPAHEWLVRISDVVLLVLSPKALAEAVQHDNTGGLKNAEINSVVVTDTRGDIA
jgi:hypothetical protein